MPASSPSLDLSFYQSLQQTALLILRSIIACFLFIIITFPCRITHFFVCCCGRTLPTKQEFLGIVLNAVPYLVFLVVYGINPFIHVLPLATDIECATLFNVSSWETFLFPWPPTHLIISSMDFILLDFLAAIPYLAHYVIPVAYPIYLFCIDRLELVQQFYRLLGISMWVHCFVWLTIPTLPPWALNYVSVGPRALRNGTTLAKDILLAHKEGQAFARIDRFTGIPFFYGMFVANPVPFASFPSGHVAWPMCILLTLPVNIRHRFGLYIAWVSWATLYTGHHFLLDIVAALVLVTVTWKVTHVQSRILLLPV